MKESFENFKNEIAHEIKRVGDIKFVDRIVQSKEIDKKWNAGEYEEALYLLASIDYLSRENMSPLCGEYKNLRTKKLEKPLFPNGILMMDKLQPDAHWKEKAVAESIPEFLRHNIIEGDIKNVI